MPQVGDHQTLNGALQRARRRAFDEYLRVGLKVTNDEIADILYACIHATFTRPAIIKAARSIGYAYTGTETNPYQCVIVNNKQINRAVNLHRDIYKLCEDYKKSHNGRSPGKSQSI